MYLFIYSYALKCLNQAYLKRKGGRRFSQPVFFHLMLRVCQAFFQAPSKRVTKLKKMQYNDKDMHRVFGKTK